MHSVRKSKKKKNSVKTSKAFGLLICFPRRRLQRAHNPISSSTFLYRSQPNLLNISDDEEEDGELHSWTSHKEHPKPVSRLSHSVSNPNLLDDSLEKVRINKSLNSGCLHDYKRYSQNEIAQFCFLIQEYSAADGRSDFIMKL